MSAMEGFVTTERERIAELEATIAHLTKQIAHMSGQLQASERTQELLLEKAFDGARPSLDGLEDMRPFLATLTPKQHAVVQMLLRGASNREIAQRMGWKEETAKGSVRNIGLRLGSTSKMGRIRREKIDARLRYTIEHMKPEDYLTLAKIPCDWDKTWTPADRAIHPFLYERRSAAA